MAENNNQSQRKSPPLPGKELGKSGTLIFSGIISDEEYNNRLTGKTGIQTFDKMRRSDATVRAALLACKLPILSATWGIEAASDDQADVTIADFVNRELFDRNVKFNDMLREALTCLDFGFSVFEKVYAKTVFENKEYIGIEKLGSRKQKTIYAWETIEKKPGITQQIIGETISIPEEKLMIFTNEREGDNYEGISILRYAFKHWDIKDKLYLIDAIKQERQALGVLEIEVPANASSGDEEAAVESARNLRANEEAYLKHPAGWKVQFMDMMARSTSDVIPSVQHHDRQIVKSVLAQFLELGATGGSGSRALSEDHSKLFELSLEALAKTLRNTFQELIHQLCDLNFSSLPNGYPKLSFGKIGDENITTISDAVQKLVSASALTPDAGMEDYLRDVLKLPEMPEEYKNDYENRPKNNPAPVAQPSLDPNELDPKTKENDVKASSLIQDIRVLKRKLIADSQKLYEQD